MAEPERSESRFEPIYSGKAAEYHELVVREDVDGNLPAALRDIVDFRGKTVVELGAGTGRVTKMIAPLAAKVLAFDQARHMLDRATSWLAVELKRNVTLTQADNRSIPLPDASTDIVIEGWSFGYTVNRTPEGWRAGVVSLVTETMRLLRPGGTAVLIETLGTGQRAPAAPGTNLPAFYTWLESEKGFSRRWIRTDYLFESMEKAQELVEFFFGAMVDHEVLPSGKVRVPECTGIWWKQKED